MSNYGTRTEGSGAKLERLEHENKLLREAIRVAIGDLRNFPGAGKLTGNEILLTHAILCLEGALKS